MAAMRMEAFYLRSYKVSTKSSSSTYADWWHKYQAILVSDEPAIGGMYAWAWGSIGFPPNATGRAPRDTKRRNELYNGEAFLVLSFLYIKSREPLEMISRRKRVSSVEWKDKGLYWSDHDSQDSTSSRVLGNHSLGQEAFEKKATSCGHGFPGSNTSHLGLLFHIYT